MDKIETFYKNGKAIIGFCVLTLIFNMIFDQKTTEKFILLVLFSMCILNADKFVDFMSNTFGGKIDSDTSSKTSDNKSSESKQ